MAKPNITRLEVMAEGPDTGPLSVISIGLFRMGTVSMAAAYNQLGLRPHHAINMNKDPDTWAILERAAEATWPQVASSPRPRFTREDWDQLYGKYDASTEICSCFAEELIQAYPTAKVVIVKRDFEKWWPSLREGVFDVCFGYRANFQRYCVLAIINNRALAAMQKILCGLFNTNYPPSLTEQQGRQFYDEYYKRIDELVPEERKLHYTLGSGWGPLCEFLGKDVPEGEFPWMNEKDALRLSQEDEVRRLNAAAIKKLRSFLPF